MSVNYREPQWLLPNEKNLQYPAADATQGSGLAADRHSLYSMYFDGSNERITTTSVDNLQNSTAVSISAWVKTNTNGNQYDTIVLAYNGGSSRYGIEVGTSGKAAFVVRTTSAPRLESTTVLSDNTWKHIVGTWDGTNTKIYINGILENTGSLTGTISTVTGLDIGGFSTGYNFDGNIDEVAIFPRALSSSEISTLYNNGSPSNPMLLSGKPVAYYPLGEQARKPGTAEWRFPNEVLQGQAIDFDGVNDYIETSDSFYFGVPPIDRYNKDTFTVSLWINADASQLVDWQYYNPISATTNGTNVGLVTRKYGNSTGYVVVSGSDFGSTQLNDGGWHNLVGVFDSSNDNWRVYVDGNSTPEINQTIASWQYFNKNVKIGQSGSETNYFPGKISNVVIWDTDQSANIDNIYNYGAPQTSYTVTPKAWYKLDKTSEYAGLNPNWHSALSFDGNNDTIQASAVIPIKSVSLWFKPNSTITTSTSGGCPISFGTTDFRNAIYLGSNFSAIADELITVMDQSTNRSYYAQSGGSISASWHHLVIVHDGTKYQIYLDGSDLTTIGSTSLITSQQIVIGARSDSSSYFNGEISNVAIYNQAISSEDVKYLYNGGTPQTNISFEPVSWWKLDNLTTGIQDSGSASNNGTNNGATAVSSSVAVDQWNFDNAVQSQTPNWSSVLDFNGSGAHIDVSSFPNALLSDGNISFSLWCKLTTTGTFQYILSSTHTGSIAGINIAINSSGLVLFERSQDIANTQNNTGYAISGFTYGNWHHLCGTYNATSGELKAYIDGVLKSTTNDSADARSASTALKIGGLSTYATLYAAKGQISNVAIFNTTLDSTAVTALYNNGQPEATISSSPVSWWKLDNTTTGIQDSVGSNNGTNNGTTEIQTNVWTPRLNAESSTLPSSALTSSDLQFNSAYSSFSLDFDGANDYVDCTDNDIFTFGNGTTDTPFSLSGWVYPDSNSRFKMLAKMDATDFEYQFGTNSSGVLSFTLYSLNTSNRIQRSYNTAITTGVWQHWVATYDGSASVSGLKIYINGVRVDDTTSTSGSYTAMQNTTSTLKLATTTLSNYANGKMDEPAIFNKELNQAEITSIYNNGYPKDLTSLSPVSWWRLGEDAYFDGTDFTIPNKISGAPNGTSDNMAATALVADAPGSYAAGLGSSLALADRIGDAPLSTANSLSFNMTPLNKVSYPSGYVPTQVDNVYSMDFDGVNDYISTGLDLDSYNSFSISAWVNADTLASNKMVCAQYRKGSSFSNSSWVLYIEAPGGTPYMTFYIFSGSSAILAGKNTVLSTGQWYHIAATWDGSTSKLYINGVKETTEGTVSSMNSTIVNTLIGASSDTAGTGTTGFWDGNIDEVAIFDYALSERQIKQDIYNGTTSGKTADLNNISNLTAPVAWYRMGD